MQKHIYKGNNTMELSILINILTLIYKERIFYKDNDNISSDIINRAMKYISNIHTATKFKGVSIVTQEKIYAFIKEMLDDNISSDKIILSRLQLDILDEGHSDLINTIKNQLEYRSDTLEKDIKDLLNTLHAFVVKRKTMAILSSKLNEVKGNNSASNIGEIIQSVIVELENTYVSKNKEHIISKFDMNDSDAMLEILNKMKLDKNGSNKDKLALIDKDLMRITQGGIGTELVLINALSHNYKSGLTNTIFMQICQANKPDPKEFENNKIPTLLFVSLEDKDIDRIKFMYQYLYKEDNGKVPDLHNFDIKEASKFIVGKLNKKDGYSVQFIHIDPTSFTHLDLYQLVIDYERKGHVIKLLVCDYLDKMSKEGLSHTTIGSEKVDLIRKIRNFAIKKNMGVITPYQLGPKARNLMTDKNISSFALTSNLPEAGAYSGSSNLNTDIDLELFINKAVDNKKNTYLSLHRGKHRGADALPELSKNILWKFPDIGPITPMSEDIVYKWMGGDTVNEYRNGTLVSDEEDDDSDSIF